MIELSKRWVNSTTFNHYIANSVLRSFADAGAAADSLLLCLRHQLYLSAFSTVSMFRTFNVVARNYQV